MKGIYKNRKRVREGKEREGKGNERNRKEWKGKVRIGRDKKKIKGMERKMK